MPAERAPSLADSTPAVGDSTLEFRTIDLQHHADVCVASRKDACVCSFGSEEAFGKAEAYLRWLREGVAREPRGHVHLWQGARIVGQLEMSIRPTAPPTGYVNLFYLLPAARGSGLGQQLHEYVVRHLQASCVTNARLRVSPTNDRAVAYYRKHGWRSLGLDPQQPSVHVMELSLGAQG